MLSVLVTAGGTRENIDTVRCVTNHSTGRLGSLIAGELIETGAKVVYLCAEDALKPESEDYTKIVVRGTEELYKTLQCLLKETRFDCIVHSMAVSDYTPFAAMSADGLADALWPMIKNISSRDGLLESLRSVLSEAGKIPAKIRSSHNELLVAMGRVPKVLDLFKTIQPDALLIGFKLLSGASENELLTAANNQIERSKCDYVLANDFGDINGDSHQAMLIDKSGVIDRAGTKQKIARMIARAIIRRYI